MVFCLGALITILSYARIPAVKINAMVTALFSCFGANLIEDDIIGHVKNGTNNLPQYIVEKVLDDKKFKSAQSNIADFISSKIQTSHKPTIIRAIKKVIANDTTISDFDIIGYQDQLQYTKNEICNGTAFDFAELLTNILYYAVSRSNNNNQKSSVKLIDEQFYKNCEIGEEIIINDDYRGSTTELSSTVNDKKFKTVFEIVPISISLDLNFDCPNSVKIFYLRNITNYKFSYIDLQNYIKSNLTHFVFSRSKMSDYDIEIAVVDALTELNDRITDERFSEIMLYSFLEHTLNAPKIMSKIEIERKASRSAGVHLLSKNTPNGTTHQLVFGSAETLNDIHLGIDNVFEQIKTIDENVDKEVKLVDSIILERPFDDETYNYVKSVIMPSKANNRTRPDNSYSAFIGYTRQVDGKFRYLSEYRNALLNQLKDDITKAVPYIQNKINELGLQNHAFYLYFLPLNDAEKDKVDIMKF